jgi:tryptophanyl-tRNA synthetase
MAVLEEKRVLSGMRATGALHLGHYHGALKNWVRLQHEYECFFGVMDWHALTTHYDESVKLEQHVWGMIIDWLASGINPGSATIFIQSKVPEHAELFLLLGMITPLSWLERVPTYKEQQEKLRDRDLANIGFLGYPLLQAADVLAYKASLVPVGDDQVSHIEMVREIARRFNHIYGKEVDHEEKAELAIDKLGKKSAKLYRDCLRAYQEQGESEALERGRALLNDNRNLSLSDLERLFGYLEGTGRIVLPEPEALLTPQSRLKGLDGQKMSKSYKNTIALREDPDVVAEKIKTMPTDPARVRKTDPGDPQKCPVWELHKVYSDQKTCDWVQNGCKNALFGCLNCKQPLIESINQEIAVFRERAKPFEEDKSFLTSIVAEGCEKARDVARDTLVEVRQAMNLDY